MTTTAFSPEDRARGQEARRLANQARAESLLRRDFADSNLWEDLAREAKVRLPQWGDPPTPGRMRRFLGRVGMTVPEYLERAGERTLADFARANPDWPARAWAGIILEWKG